MSFRPVVILVFALLGLAVRSVHAELSLGELRSKFEVAMESNQTEFDEKSGKLREGYSGALERLKVSLGREGKLEQAAQILAELEVLEAKGEITPLSNNVDYRFQGLRTKWQREQAKLEEARRKSVVELATVYLKVLDERKDGLTRAGEIRQALVLEEEAKRVEDLPVVVEAMVDPEEQEEKSITAKQLSKLLVGTKWTYQRFGEKSTLPLKFNSSTEAEFGLRFMVEWEALPDRKIQLTKETFKQAAVFQFDEELKTFKGTGSDGGRVSGERVGPLGDEK